MGDVHCNHSNFVDIFQVRNGHIKRITDNDIQSLVLEIVGTNVRSVNLFKFNFYLRVKISCYPLQNILTARHTSRARLAQKRRSE